MSSVTSCTLSRFKRARPDAVVAEHPLRAGRVVRHDLVEQVGPVGELGLRGTRSSIRRTKSFTALTDSPFAGPSRDRRGRRRARRRPSARRSRSGSTRCTTARARRATAGRRRPRRGSRASGPSHGGVRWNTSSSPTSVAISGMNCTALAPVPMTATRLPAQVDVVVPARRVERRSLRTSRGPRCRGARPVELADRADDRVRVDRLLARRRRRGPRRVQRSVASSDHVAETHLGAEADVLAELERRRRSAGSSRAARPGSRSGTASRGAARTSSCSCGSGCRPGSRDSCSRARCRRRRRSSRRSRTATPACCRRCAASRPDMPAPMITTRKSTSGATSALRHAGARRSSPR